MLNGANVTPDQIIPFWYRLYHNLSRERTSYITVTYSPIIDAKPVDKTTMYTMIRKWKDMSAALGQHHAFQTIDQQLYAFAQQLKCAFLDELWDRDMSSHQHSYSWIIYSRPYRSFIWMFGKSDKVTGVFIYRRNQS